MTQNLQKELAVGHDYTSEDAPRSDRIQWYITQTLAKLAQAVHNRDLKILLTHLADTHSGTHVADTYNGTHVADTCNGTHLADTYNGTHL